MRYWLRAVSCPSDGAGMAVRFRHDGSRVHEVPITPTVEDTVAQSTTTAVKMCDVCKKPVGARYVDGKVIRGPWATMCVWCHAAIGVGIGTGKGQLYETATGHKLEG